MNRISAFLFCLCFLAAPAFGESSSHAAKPSDAAPATKQSKAKTRMESADVDDLRKVSPNFYKQSQSRNIVRAGDQPAPYGSPDAKPSRFSAEIVRQNPFHDDSMFTPLNGYAHDGPLAQKFSYEAIHNGNALDMLNIPKLLKQRPEDYSEYDNVYN